MNTADIEKAVIEAAEKSNLGRFQKARIERIMTGRFRPIAKKNITDRVTAALLAEEMIVASDSGVEFAVDWESILAFIERLLPLILQLISLFG